MRNREEYNAYMKAYQQRKRDEMTFEEWRAFRDKNNAYHKKRYDNRTPEQIEKNRAYQRQKQKLYYWMKNKDNESDKVGTINGYSTFPPLYSNSDDNSVEL